MTDHTTAEVRARIEESIVRQGLMTALGARLDRIEPGGYAGPTVMYVFTHRAGERKLVAAGQQTLIRVEG